ncbi:MAG: hypothetical protein AAB209_00810 [Bacteroidota bacterium]
MSVTPLKRNTVLSALCFVAVVYGCKDDALRGRICTTEARTGIQIAVRDAATGAPAAYGVLAIAQDISFTDTLRALPYGTDPQSALTMVGVYERPGVYTVILMKPGYRDWMRTNIVVNKDECHVITVQLDARLERTP